MKPSCRARTSELLKKGSECFESLSMNGKILNDVKTPPFVLSTRRTPTEFSATLLEKVLRGRATRACTVLGVFAE